MHVSVQLPETQTGVSPLQLALLVHVPFWKAPIGPTGEAQVLVT